MADAGMRWDTPKDPAMKLRETVEGDEVMYVKRAPFLVIINLMKVIGSMGEGWVLSLLNAAFRNKILTGYRPLASFAGQSEKDLRTGVLERNIFGIKVRLVSTEVKVETLLTIKATKFTIREDEDEEVQEATRLAFAQQYLLEMSELGIDAKTQKAIREKQGF